MKKPVRFLLAGAALFFAGTAAHAQYSLTVTAPANLAGTVAGTTLPDDTWGFGDPAAITPVSGTCQVAAPDSLAQNSANVGNLTGKVAVCYRGVTEFGAKALACQTAGAIAVIIINNDNPPPSTLGPGAVGATVTIPVIMATKAWGLSVRNELRAGQLVVSLGNLRGTLANNLSIKFDQNFIPDAFMVPGYMVQQVGDLAFKVGGFAYNFGSAAQPSAVLKAQIRRVDPDPTVLYIDSLVFSNSIAVDDSVGDIMRPFDLVTAEPSRTNRNGHYQLVYTVYTPGVTDQNPTDNVQIYDFWLDQNVYTKSRVNMDRSSASFFKPFYTIGITKQGGGALKWGHYHRTGSTAGIVNSITFAAGVATGSSIVGETIEAEVHRWDDTNNDSLMTSDEITLLGSGSHTYTAASEEDVFFTVPVQDVNTSNDGVQLEANKRYLYLLSYSGSNTVFLAADQDKLDYTLNFFNADNKDKYIVLFNGTDWSRFSLNTQTALRVNIGQNTLDTTTPVTAIRKEVANSITKLSVHPNPAQDQIQVTVGDKVGTGVADIRIRDLAGRVYTSQQLPLQGASSSFKVSTASLPVGVYSVEVATGRGTRSAKLVITR